MNLDKAMSNDMTGSYVDDRLDSAIPAYEDQVRFPDVATYDPLTRLAWLEMEDERFREDNDLHHQIMNHAQDCAQTHYYWVGEETKPACTSCMLDINKLYGVRPYYEIAKKEAA